MATKQKQGTLNTQIDMGLESIRPIVAELERAANWFVNRYQLSELASQKHTVVIYNGPKPAKCYGWFKGHEAEKDKHNKPTGKLLYPWYTIEGDGVVEIMLTGQFLNRSVHEILTTLFHEQIHALANARGIKDVAGSGRHNQKFQELAATCGLSVEQDDKGSYTQTKMMPSLAESVETELIPDASIFRLAAAKFQSKPKMENKRVKFVCQCETGVQRKGAEFRSVMATHNLKAHCYDCDSDFVKAS